MKKFKPSYIVNITKCEDTLDMIVAIAYAKIDANEGQFVICDDSVSSEDNHDL